MLGEYVRRWVGEGCPKRNIKSGGDPWSSRRGSFKNEKKDCNAKNSMKFVKVTADKCPLDLVVWVATADPWWGISREWMPDSS